MGRSLQGISFCLFCCGTFFPTQFVTSGLVSVIELWGQNNCKSLACSLRVIISLQGKSNILTFSSSLNDPLECRLEPGFRKGHSQGMLKGAIPIGFAFWDWRRAVVKLYRGSGEEVFPEQGGSWQASVTACWKVRSHFFLPVAPEAPGALIVLPGAGKRPPHPGLADLRRRG